jgi:hypothetical protein
MKSEINDDKLYLQLQEAWMANEADIEEATATANKEVYFTNDDIVDRKGKGIKLRAAVEGEDGSPAYIDLIVPIDYIRNEDGKMRLSSKYVRRAISNFNKGLYATGGIDVSTGYAASEENKPTNKLKELKIVKPQAKLPRYSKSGKETKDIKDQLVEIGVKIDPNGENKKAPLLYETRSLKQCHIIVA